MPAKIHVSIAEQTLTFWKSDSEPPTEFPISTSRFGVGMENGSYRTPIGKFEICEKHGADAEINTIFKGRIPIGVYDPNEPIDSDLVLTRILWLNGLESHNENTKSRYIYIHGTNQEHLIGRPASMGCVRMLNSDIIDFFDQVPLNCPMTISEN